MTSSDFLLNDLELSIIKILYKNPHTPFNYEMMWAYLKLTEDFLEIMGAMQSLEKNGFIYPSIENKKYYYLSDDGKRYLQRIKKKGITGNKFGVPLLLLLFRGLLFFF